MKRFSIIFKCVLAFVTLFTTASAPLSYTYWATSKRSFDQSGKSSKRSKRSLELKESSPFSTKIPQSSSKKSFFKPLEIYDISKIQLDESSPLVDPIEDRSYLKFIWSLWRIMNSTLWVDEVYGLPWIESIEGVFPENTFKEKGVNISINHEAYPFESAQIEKEDFYSKADKVKVSLTAEIIKNMKENSSREEIIQIRQNIGDVFSSFFLKDWNPQTELNYLTFENTIKTFFTTFTTPIVKKDKDSTNREIRTLRFIRKFKNQFYYLDINFNTKAFENTLMIQYVWYKDSSWYRGGYYQANGEYNNYRDKIGGNVELDKSQGYPISDIDEEFKTMFENIYNKPDIFYKFVLTIKECLELPECALLFHRNKNDYYVLSQRIPEITEAHIKECYKYIHPFANKYYKVEEMINNEPPGPFLFPIKIVSNSNLSEMN